METKTEELLKDLERQGARASDQGQSFRENPLLLSEAAPERTGLALEEWELRHDAWHLGWALREAVKLEQRVAHAVLTTRDFGRHATDREFGEVNEREIHRPSAAGRRG